MFTNIEINVFIPKDPNLITQLFNINDMIEDEFEKLECLKYFVRITFRKNLTF
jgi:hypothetical protein